MASNSETETGSHHSPRRPRSVGIIGGGQLARMMIPATINLGVGARVLTTNPDDSAAQVCADVQIGHHEDAVAVRAFAQTVDVVTFDHEHVPLHILEALVDEGHEVHPGPHALVFAQDKLRMRERLTELGHPCPQWWRIQCEHDLDAALEEAAGPLVVKTARGGYDGKGVRVVSQSCDVSDWLESGTPLLAERMVPFTRELSAQVARSTTGVTCAYPVVQSQQKDGVCFQVIAPAPGLDDERQQQIQNLAIRIAEDLQVVGMLAVELFEEPNGRISVNELAMRPHNTGHWSMDGAATSQFEQHIRAVLGMPLGSPIARPGGVMVNLLGGPRQDLVAGAEEAWLSDADLKVHIYGKDVRPGRKVGHVTLVGEPTDTLGTRALQAARTIIGENEGEHA